LRVIQIDFPILLRVILVVDFVAQFGYNYWECICQLGGLVLNNQSSQNIDKLTARKIALDIELDRILSVLINEYDPIKIILFGSLVNGNIHEYSDIDLDAVAWRR